MVNQYFADFFCAVNESKYAGLEPSWGGGGGGGGGEDSHLKQGLLKDAKTLEIEFIFLHTSSRATLNETLTAKNIDTLPGARLVRLKIRKLHP